MGTYSINLNIDKLKNFLTQMSITVVFNRFQRSTVFNSIQQINIQHSPVFNRLFFCLFSLSLLSF